VRIIARLDGFRLDQEGRGDRRENQSLQSYYEDTTLAIGNALFTKVSA
jgi:hypothetical protein